MPCLCPVWIEYIREQHIDAAGPLALLNLYWQIQEVTSMVQAMIPVQKINNGEVILSPTSNYW